MVIDLMPVLVYVSSSTERYQPQKTGFLAEYFNSRVSLGLGIVGDIQDIVHRSLDGKRPQGWDNQISEGGEPTARYSVARQQLIYQSGSRPGNKINCARFDWIHHRGQLEPEFDEPEIFKLPGFHLILN